MSTKLKNRILHYDGTIQVDPELVSDLFLYGIKPEKIIVNTINQDIELFNSLSDFILRSDKLETFKPDLSWKIPEKYLDLDLDITILEKAKPLGDAYLIRAKKELIEIRKRGLESFFKTLIYVIDVFKQNNVLWGVGRGSSCASIVLYLIGLHMVDPIKYGIDLEEFFHD